MKKLYAVLYILSFLALITAGIFFIFMPGEVPVHYNFAGEIDRMGSKYEYLIMPVVTVILGVATAAAAKDQAKKSITVNEKVLLVTGISMVAVFNVMSFFLMLKAQNYTGEAVPLDTSGLGKIIAICLGGLLVVLGNIMPKVRRNSLFGLRTKWSMASDLVWQKSQRAGGLFAVIFGLAMVFCGIFIEGTACVVVTVSLMVVWVFASAAASFAIYKKDGQNK